MLQFLFDTDHLTLFEFDHALVKGRHTREPPDTIGISPITVQEVLRGRLAAVSRSNTGAERVRDYGFFITSVLLFRQFPIVAYDDGSELQFQHLLALKLRVGTQDLKIAAVALANNLTLLTRNRRDFSRVPNLLMDDWSV